MDDNTVMEVVLAKLDAIEARLTDDDKKAEVKALRRQLVDKTITIAELMTTKTFKGLRWGFNKSQPLSRSWNGVKGFFRGCWSNADPKDK